MNQDVELQCRCGQVRGRVTDASPRTVSRVVCYCDDCQAFLHHLGRKDLLDGHGGTDIVQVAPASLTFQQGADRIVGLRLSQKGLHRWYASCCSTPLGNTVSPAIPFVGIVSQAFGEQRDAFGPPIGALFGKFAVGGAPEGSTGLNIPLFARAIRMILGWRLTGRAWPHPFFEHSTRAARYQVNTLPAPEREALRKLCGPRPS
jgi:hypothetical protein